MKFWSNWLVGVSIFGIVFGVVLLLPGGLQTVLAQWAYDALAGPGAYAELTAGQLANQRLLYGIMSAVMIGWFMLIAWLALIPFRRGERWAWLALDSSLLAWFVLDSIISVQNGFAQNVIINLVFLVLFAIPLAATWRQFEPLKMLRPARA